jgi:hypothetical protein
MSDLIVRGGIDPQQVIEGPKSRDVDFVVAKSIEDMRDAEGYPCAFITEADARLHLKTLPPHMSDYKIYRITIEEVKP